jgi:hypothetical protein
MKEKTGTIQYYAMKHKGFIRRRIKWTDKCKEWVSNSGVKLLTYLDLDRTEEFGKDQYRTAARDWFIKWN